MTGGKGWYKYRENNEELGNRYNGSVEDQVTEIVGKSKEVSNRAGEVSEKRNEYIFTFKK